MATLKEKAKAAIADISKLLFGTELKFMDATTSDGTALKIEGEELKEGAGVTDAEGNAVADGDYTLESGTIITCAAGVITKVVATADDAAAGQEAMKSAAGKFATGTPEERIANLETVVKALMDYCFGWQMQEATRDKAIEVYQTTIAAHKEEIGAVKDTVANVTKSVGDLLPIISELANSPLAEPTEPARTNFSASKPDPAEQIEKVRQAILEAKNK